jgi:hypothetical protein
MKFEPLLRALLPKMLRILLQRVWLSLQECSSANSSPDNDPFNLTILVDIAYSLRLFRHTSSRHSLNDYRAGEKETITNRGLYRVESGDMDAYPHLQAVLSRPIN